MYAHCPVSGLQKFVMNILSNKCLKSPTKLYNKCLELVSSIVNYHDKSATYKIERNPKNTTCVYWYVHLAENHRDNLDNYASVQSIFV